MVMVVDQELPDESQGLFVSQDPNHEPESYRAHAESVEPEEPTQSRRATRKRPGSPVIEEKSYMDNFAPATASFKRQRRERGELTPPPPVIKNEVVVPQSSKKKEKKEVDILALAAQQRERTEAAARAEEESLKQTVSAIDIEEMRKLTIVEEMEVKRSRPAPKATTHVDESERWDDKWNGRKNFKKFRRRGANEDGPVRPHARVIVPLEEVKKNGHGLSEENWGLGGEDDTQRRRRKGKGKETQTPAETQEPDPSTSSRSKTKPKTRTPAREINSDNEDQELPENAMDARLPSQEPEVVLESEDEVVDPDAFRPTPVRTPASTGRRIEKSITQGSSLRSSGVSVSNSIGVGVNKRAATNTLTRAAAAKKPRMTSRRKVDDSDEDEDRFVFR